MSKLLVTFAESHVRSCDLARSEHSIGQLKKVYCAITASFLLAFGTGAGYITARFCTPQPSALVSHRSCPTEAGGARMVHARMGRPVAPGRVAASCAALHVRPCPCASSSHATGMDVNAHAPQCACAPADGMGRALGGRGTPARVGVQNTPGEVRLPLTVLPGVPRATGSSTTLRRMTGPGRRGIRAWTRMPAFGDRRRVCGCAPVDEDTRMIEQGLRCLFERCAHHDGAFCVVRAPSAYCVLHDLPA